MLHSSFIQDTAVHYTTRYCIPLVYKALLYPILQGTAFLFYTRHCCALYYKVLHSSFIQGTSVHYASRYCIPLSYKVVQYSTVQCRQGRGERGRFRHKLASALLVKHYSKNGMKLGGNQKYYPFISKQEENQQ